MRICYSRIGCAHLLLRDVQLRCCNHFQVPSGHPQGFVPASLFEVGRKQGVVPASFFEVFRKQGFSPASLFEADRKQGFVPASFFEVDRNTFWCERVSQRVCFSFLVGL